MRIFKWCRVKSASIDGEPAVTSLKEFQTGAEQVPTEIWAAVEEPGLELAKLGFSAADSAFFRVPNPEAPGIFLYRLILRHSEGPAFARLDVRVIKDKVTLRSTSFLTPLKEGRWIVSRNGAPEPYPEIWKVSEEKGRSISETWAVHGATIQAQRNRLELTPPSTLEAMEEFHQSVARFMEISGFWVKLDAADVLIGSGKGKPVPANDMVPVPSDPAQTPPVPPQAIAGAHPGLPPAEFVNGDTMSEDERLELAMVDVSDQELKVISEQVEYLDKGGMTWKKAIALSLILMVLFGPWLFMDSEMFSLGSVVIIVGIIFFHELGHFLAMKLFGYRNVRMLIIPMVGGAVMGQNRDAPGWKKVVVSLAGPLPGIVAGIILGTVSVFADIALLREIAIWALIINGLNLIPVLPLDGGHIVNELIFKRSAVMEIIALIGGALGMLLLGLFLIPFKIAIIITVSLFAALPVIYRNAKVAKALRNQITPDVDSSQPGMDSKTLRDIVRGINAAWPRALTPRAYATLAVDIYERACSKIPNAFASLFFLGVHGAAFMMALIACIGLAMVHTFGGTQQMLSVAEAAESGDWEKVQELLPGHWDEDFQAGWEEDEEWWDEESEPGEEAIVGDLDEFVRQMEAQAAALEAEFKEMEGTASPEGQ